MGQNLPQTYMYNFPKLYTLLVKTDTYMSYTCVYNNSFSN